MPHSLPYYSYVYVYFVYRHIHYTYIFIYTHTHVCTTISADNILHILLQSEVVHVQDVRTVDTKIYSLGAVSVFCKIT